MAKFKIGDKVFVASCKNKHVYRECEICQGKKFLTVILGDDSKVTIDCETCKRGYEKPSGRIEIYEFLPDIEQIKIDGVTEFIGNDVEYRQGCHVYYEKNVFKTKEEAAERAKILEQENNVQQEKEFENKMKSSKSWGWHVHYYKGLIKRAKKEIERCSKLLSVAEQKMNTKTEEAIKQAEAK